MANYTKNTNEETNEVVYKLGTKNVSKEEIPEEILEKLEIASEGTKVPENSDVQASGNEAKDEKPSEKTKTIKLRRPICINGQVYVNKRSITVPKAVAEDLQRIDDEIDEQERNLIKSEDRTRRNSDVRES
jgi:hypothetical protein